MPTRTQILDKLDQDIELEATKLRQTPSAYQRRGIRPSIPMRLMPPGFAAHIAAYLRQSKMPKAELEKRAADLRKIAAGNICRLRGSR